MGIDTTSLLLNYGALGVVLILLLTGVLVPGFVYRKLERENETYRDALSVERQRNADLQQFAVTGQKAIVALTEVAEERRRGNAESRGGTSLREETGIPLKAGDEMFFLWWLKSARRHLTQRHQIAEKELARSKALLAEDRRNIELPLRAADQRNHFSDIIHDALDVGYGPAGRKGVPGE